MKCTDTGFVLVINHNFKTINLLQKPMMRSLCVHQVFRELVNLLLQEFGKKDVECNITKMIFVKKILKVSRMLEQRKILYTTQSLQYCIYVSFPRKAAKGFSVFQLVLLNSCKFRGGLQATSKNIYKLKQKNFWQRATLSCFAKTYNSRSAEKYTCICMRAFKVCILFRAMFGSDKISLELSISAQTFPYSECNGSNLLLSCYDKKIYAQVVLGILIVCACALVCSRNETHCRYIAFEDLIFYSFIIFLKKNLPVLTSNPLC